MKRIMILEKEKLCNLKLSGSNSGPMHGLVKETDKIVELLT